MIIVVNHRYHYNAPADIKIGDRVELPRAGFDRYTTPTTWIGEVTGIPPNSLIDYSGNITAIVGKVEPLELTLTAETERGLLEQLQDSIDAILARRQEGGR